ncbi:XIAP-associated factor 1-like isoform X2 [Gouania willdenowi]|uniref:XIAP-associated factor 1-like isoform X2 n=1 Tax=Gouania willdenowi TaxID=441366 RepID=UPI001055916A|nr:XIAP-associated factor 1 isoform X2 [Gouania willdenowi]
MEKNGTVHTCSWCHKDVAEENFALHEMHCSRFLSLCPDCGETVPSEQVEQHREEQHTQVRCSQCSQKMERCHLEDHEENECVERLQSCSFCELELPWKQLDEHCLACGSRTERCLDCGRYVKLCDQPQHDSTCSDSKNTSKIPSIVRKKHSVQKPVTCMFCRKLFPPEEIYEHELIYDMGQNQPVTVS